MGIAGTTAWALMISVTNPVPNPLPYVDPPVHLETQAECETIADAINAKAQQAGVQQQLSADCRQIEFIELPEKQSSPQS